MVKLYFKVVSNTIIFLAFLLLAQAEGAVLKSVQRGTATFASGANTTTITINLVDTSKTIVWGGISWGGGRFASSNANATRFGFQLVNPLTLNLQRLGAPAQATVAEWYVAEFSKGVLVQRGRAAFAAGTATLNVTISAIDTTKTFVLVSSAINSASQTNDERWTIRARLTSNTNLELSRNETGTVVDAYWQVIQIDSAVVQRGLTTIGAGASSATVAISSVDTTKSFLVLSARAAAAVSGVESRYMVRGRITSPIQLTFDRIDTTISVQIAWEVVSLNDGSLVRSGSVVVPAANPSQSAIFPSVDTTRSISLISLSGGAGTATANLDETAFTHRLTSDTSLTFTRAGTGTAANLGWFVIQFIPNFAPLLDSIGAKSVAEGFNLTFRIHASDPNADSLILTASNVPLNAAFVDSGNGAGSFNFNPNFAQAGVYNVTFKASDGALIDSEVVQITVNNTIGAPVLDSIGSKTIAEGANLNFRVHASDPEGDSTVLTAGNIPSNAVFIDSGNGAGSFSFNPDYTQAGSYVVVFKASDGSLSDSEIVDITVSEVCLAKAGDVTGDNQVLLSDIVALINFLFKGAPAPVPFCRGDVNASGTIVLSDIVYLVNFLFKFGPTPVPHLECCL